MKPVNENIFRAYDIRGVVDVDFDNEWVREFGKACGTYFRDKGLRRAVVGRDCRLSSPAYQLALAEGLAMAGVDVILLHMVPTPIFYYGVITLGARAGVMITASHNPPEYNGFKIWAGDTTIHSDEIRAIYRIMRKADFTSGKGVVSEFDIVPDYVDEIAKQIKLERPVKVVLDAGNGAAGSTALELFKRVGADVIPLYCEPDGTFPNHHPDPVVERHMGDLLLAVKDHGAELGIGLDGDGDRVGAVDEQGRMVYGDRLLAIYARDVLRDHPGAMVIGEVKCSHLLYKDIAAHGGEPLMWITGHSVMKAKLKEARAKLAGEMSGHMFFADRYYGTDDATYAALRLLEIVSRDHEPLSARLDDWPQTYNTPEIRMECPESIKFQVVERAREHLADKGELITVDGVRITFDDGWGLIRASNTQPALALRFEAETPERLKQIQDLIELPLAEWIRELGGDPKAGS